MKKINKVRSRFATVIGIGGAIAVGCSACCVPFVTPLLLTLFASAGIYCYDDIPGTWIAVLAGVVALSLGVWTIARRRGRSKGADALESCTCKASCSP